MEGIMRNDIKIVIIVVSCILILIFILFVMGRKLNVNTDRQVEGLDQELQEILYLAALAPSSHNIQGWKTKVDPKNSLITIEADRSRALSVVDPKNRELKHAKNSLRALRDLRLCMEIIMRRLLLSAEEIRLSCGSPLPNREYQYTR